MSSVEDLAFAPTFHHMYGAQLLASIINTFLYGTSLIITLQYFRRFGRNDPLALKGTVALLICSATVETTASAHQTYDSFITKFGRQELFNEIVPSVTIEFLFVYVTAFIAQCFFATRIWKVGKHFGFKFQWLTIPVIALAFLQLGAGIAQVSLMIKSKLYSTLDQHTATLVKVTTMQGVAAAICDILITVVLCWAFHSHRSGTRRTNSLVDKLIIYAINRGSATSICALLNVLLYYFASGTFYFLIPLQATTHFYVISAVTVLTSREGLRQEMDNSFHLSDLIVSNRSEAQTATSSVSPNLILTVSPSSSSDVRSSLKQHDQRMTKEKEGPRDV
ncbi:hypothetical protein CC1G_08944 [Coprinopsis cinerea okayama7|uniref:DUF6534 domain-containing protein n=1 Tax=Coprinopsis cinerea (strain Okayama-7 / 130 / ATCC MYA-4618 / FGSC 9003) TaxID=240176 RepID=A8P4P2_COPC7|nr:hypothetical protein CC1G_08944 [Coprinopsis cinerea okayama7\|eukprot:XP_001838780.2 hypothetical protein CC1G_08944 [Coprinopsis cinerea okayama7\